MEEQLNEGDFVQHKTRKLYEARFVGYTKTGKVKVRHNAVYPYGVYWVVDAFKPENIKSDMQKR